MQKIEINSTDQFTLSGGEVIAIIDILGQLPASQTGDLYLSLKNSIALQKQEQLINKNTKFEVPTPVTKEE